MTYQVGEKIELGVNTAWHGFYEIFEVIKNFKNGKIAVRVLFKGKMKVFNI